MGKSRALKSLAEVAWSYSPDAAFCALRWRGATGNHKSSHGAASEDATSPTTPVHRKTITTQKRPPPLPVHPPDLAQNPARGPMPPCQGLTVDCMNAGVVASFRYPLSSGAVRIEIPIRSYVYRLDSISRANGQSNGCPRPLPRLSKPHQK